jgi:hypothetical protein
MADLEVWSGRLVEVRRGDDLAAHAALLYAVAGPGAPEVVDFRPGSDGVLASTVLPPLRLGDLTIDKAVAALADVAGVLARAHAGGVVHGPIRAEHVQGTLGNVLLGGWTAAGKGTFDDDVAELGRLIEEVAVRHPRLRAVAHRALADDRPTAAAVAASLRATGRENEPQRHQNHAQFVVGLAAAVAVVVGTLAFLFGATGSASADKEPTPTPPTTERVTAVVEHEGRRLRIGTAGDVVVTGRFQCRDAIPAVLRPSSGQLWVFPSWDARTGNLVATIPGATSVGHRRDGACDRLEVRDAQGRWRAVG